MRPVAQPATALPDASPAPATPMAPPTPGSPPAVTPALMTRVAGTPATATVSLGTRVNVAVHGVRLTAPVSRRAGAGPSDDGHVLLAGRGAALPIVATSRYEVSAAHSWDAAAAAHVRFYRRLPATKPGREPDGVGAHPAASRLS